MRFYHPEPFVHAPRDFRKYIGAVRVADLVAGGYGPASELAKRRECRSESQGVIMTAGGLGVVFRQVRPLHNHARRSFGITAKLDGALGDEINIFFYILVHLIEELVQSDEVRSFDVPVRVLALRLQIDCISQTCIAQFDNLGASRLW